jgi:hypothetical protein
VTKDAIITDRLILRHIGARDAEAIAMLIDNYKIAVMLHLFNGSGLSPG